MKILLLLPVLTGASIFSAAAPAGTRRTYLDQPTVIHGYFPWLKIFSWNSAGLPSGHPTELNTAIDC